MSVSGKNDFLLGVLVGAAAGAAAALLYAPAPGTETRGQVMNVAGDAMDRAAGVASVVKDKAVDVTSKAQDVASTVKDRAADVATRVKSQAQDLASRGQDKAKEMADQVSDFASDVKGKVVPAGNGGSNGNGQGNWAEELPQNVSTGEKEPDLHTLQTSDEPDIVADRINDAMQGSGDEAHNIAEELAQAPSGPTRNS